MNGFKRMLLAGLWLSAGAWLTSCADRAHSAGGDMATGAPRMNGNTGPIGANDLGQLEPPEGAGQTISNAGSYVVSYVTHPHPIPLNEMFTIEFWVRPMVQDISATDNIRVDVDARMPHHHHGMYRVPLVRHLGGSGHYEAVGMLFHMPGYWEVYFDIMRGGMTERAQFSVEID